MHRIENSHNVEPQILRAKRLIMDGGEEWNEIAHNALIDAYVGPTTLQRQSEVHYRNGLVLGRNRVDHHSVNFAFRSNQQISAAEAVDTALNFFSTSKSGFGFSCRDWADADVLDVACERGMTVAYTEAPLMVAEGCPAELVSPPHTRVLSAPSQRLATDFAHIASTVFGDSESQRWATLDVFDGTDMFSPFIRYFVAYVDGIPAAISSLWFSRLIPGIYWVATLEQFRNRGLGRLVTLAAWHSAREAGCRFVTLQASPSGLPIYAKLGFKEVGTFSKVAMKIDV